MTFYEIDETLILDDPTMVLLDFSLPRDLKIHGKSIQKSTLKNYLQNSLPNQHPDRFFWKNCEIDAKSDPQMNPKIIKSHEKSKFGLGVGPEAPQDSPRIPKVLQKLSKVSPKGIQ